MYNNDIIITHTDKKSWEKRIFFTHFEKIWKNICIFLMIFYIMITQIKYWKKPTRRSKQYQKSSKNDFFIKNCHKFLDNQYFRFFQTRSKKLNKDQKYRFSWKLWLFLNKLYICGIKLYSQYTCSKQYFS